MNFFGGSLKSPTLKIITTFCCISSLLCISLQSNASNKRDEIYISQQECPISENTPSNSNDSIQLHCKSYRQTTTYTCGPAAIMTLMQYYKRLSASEMTKKTELRIAIEMGANNKGVTLSQMANWLRNHGLSVETGTRVTSAMIIDNLKKGIPTLIVTDNHWVLAKGYHTGNTSNQSEITFSDPCCGTTTISASEIDSLWAEEQIRGNHCGKNAGNYIVAK